ncbi:MAG TPA: iron-sulfur cluster assembly scaffold protein [Gammaproteobacteria bacterium]|nr:iron-sulfur cluster assembly scaffold protein [Gammaproteobacteria bacterium]
MALIPAGLLLEHFRAPRNSGVFPPDTPSVLEGRAGASRHGREITVQLQLAADGRIAACRYRVYGDPATIALCSLASEALQGLTLDEAAAWRGMALAGQLELPAEKRGAVLVLEDAVRAAVRSYNRQHRPNEADLERGRT